MHILSLVREKLRNIIIPVKKRFLHLRVHIQSRGKTASCIKNKEELCFVHSSSFSVQKFYQALENINVFAMIETERWHEDKAKQIWKICYC